MKKVFSIVLLLTGMAFGQGVTVAPKTTISANTGVFPGTAGGGKTWTLVQHPKNFTCTFATGAVTAPCTVTSSATTAGNLLVLIGTMFVSGPVGVPGGGGNSASGDGTWTHCPSQLAAENYSGVNWEASDCFYITSATGGATSEIFTWAYGSNSSFGGSVDAELLEFHPSSGGATYETCGGGGSTACTTTSASCSACTGPTTTVTGTDVVVVANANENDCTAVASPFNVSPSPDVDNVNVFGLFGWSLSQTSGNAASYTCTAGGAAMLAAAWK